MVQKYVFGTPVETYAVVEKVPVKAEISEEAQLSLIPHLKADMIMLPRKDGAADMQTKGLHFKRKLQKGEAVYGLGETMHGINKRGFQYISYNTDDPHHTEKTKSLYGSHNFLVIEDILGIFFDTPARVTFDIDVNQSGMLEVTAETTSMNLYFIEGDSSYGIVKEFRRIIGRSFLPPLWAFGYCQSRWGYRSQKDVMRVVESYRKAGIPLDSVCMDIDYMDRFIDFTIHPRRFPNLKEFSARLKEQGIHLVPIIDAGIKIEPGNEVYEEGVLDGYFCTNEEGKPFSAAVWPGMTHFPDFFQPDARSWFGSKYKVLTDCGIEGFWNDMNEPAIFYSENSPRRTMKEILLGLLNPARAEANASKESNAYRDYKHFYHLVDKKRVLHHDVHNLYGGLMTMAGNEGLTKLLPHRFLLYSRASYIGAHRYGGIWTGDNSSCWEHLRVNICQMPSLQMCGFLFIGADTGGFGANCDRELLLRWLAFSVFTPLMRNHSALHTRKQECYRFGDTGDFRRVISLRYRLLPYLYSEFMKAALQDEMYMRPLAFDFPDDACAKTVEDQLMVGGDLMVAPVVEQGAEGRKVYLPEDMTQIRFDGESFSCEPCGAGWHEIKVSLHEVVFFLRKGHAIVVAERTVQSTRELNLDEVQLLGEGEYLQYLDDGVTREVTMENVRLRK